MKKSIAFLFSKYRYNRKVIRKTISSIIRICTYIHTYLHIDISTHTYNNVIAKKLEIKLTKGMKDIYKETERH